MLEVAFEEWAESHFVDVDTRSYDVWAKYNWWMVPWWDLIQGTTDDPFGTNDTSTSTSVSTSDGFTSVMPSSR